MEQLIVSFSAEAITAITGHFESLGLKSLIVGATARDMIAERFKLPKAKRQTSDIDFAVLVESWDDLEKIENALLADKDIQKTPAEKEKIPRFTYKLIPFDVVPFGGIEKDHKVSWPPFYDTLMTVLGYQEAFRHSIPFTIGTRTVYVINTESLIALKLIAWNENRVRQRDLVDIEYLIQNYEKIEPDAYAYILDHYLELLEPFDHDPEFAEPLLMGIKLRATLEEETAQKLISILDAPGFYTGVRTTLIPAHQHDNPNEMLNGDRLKRKFEALSSGLKTKK